MQKSKLALWLRLVVLAAAAAIVFQSVARAQFNPNPVIGNGGGGGHYGGPYGGCSTNSGDSNGLPPV